VRLTDEQDQPYSAAHRCSHCATEFAICRGISCLPEQVFAL